MENLLNSFNSSLLEYFDKLLPPSGSTILGDAMRYTVLAPAKHIRSFLFISSAEVFGITDQSRLMPICVAIELIHAYSLIHDDLPAIDNDEFRRGQLSSHRRFDEATAILAGDALLTLAFEILSGLDEDGDLKCNLIKVLAHTVGYAGMVMGQMLDIKSQNGLNIEDIHLFKTAKFFSVVCEMGALIGKADKYKKSLLVSYGLNFGLAFQIDDDVSDIGHDTAGNNITAVIGKEMALVRRHDLLESAVASLNVFAEEAKNLRALIQHVFD